MRKYRLLLLPAILLIMLFSCKTIVKLRNINLHSLYNPELNELNPGIYVFNHEEDKSVIYLKINSDELHYIKKPDETRFKANLSIKFMVLPSFDSTKFVDSAKVLITDSLFFETGNYILDSLEFYAPEGSNYLLHMVIRDINRRIEHVSVHRINKKSRYSLQNFRLYDEKGELLYYPYISQNTFINAFHRDKKTIKLNGVISNQEHRAASPPFVAIDDALTKIIPDSSFTLTLNNGIGLIPVNKHGHYRLFFENDTAGGFSLYYFHQGFPYINTHEAMLMPIRYLVSNAEFNSLVAHADKRSAIDRFWVGIAGDASRARSLVSRYYNNVQSANIFFTSYKEGWKTDRGIIYTIYGPPDIVFINDITETWHYKDSWRMMELRFDFTHKPHPFTDNHFVLERKPEYRNPWFAGIENWRK